MLDNQKHVGYFIWWQFKNQSEKHHKFVPLYVVGKVFINYPDNSRTVIKFNTGLDQCQAEIARFKVYGKKDGLELQDYGYISAYVNGKETSNKHDIFDTYDWKEAFAFAETPEPAAPTIVVNCATVKRENVTQIKFMRYGANEDRNWFLVGQLKDGRWFSLDAGCDYTGWYCQAWGKCWVANTEQEIIQFGMTNEQRLEFGVETIGISQ